MFFYDVIHDLFQHAGGAHIAIPMILQPITFTFTMIFTLVSMDITLSMIPHILVLRSIHPYLFHLTGTNYLYLPCTTVRSMINHPHSSCNSDFYSTSTSPTVYSSRRARSYHFLEHSTCILSLTGSVPTVRSFPPRCHAWAEELPFVWGIYYRIGLLGVSVSYISLIRRGLWLWIDCQSPLVSFRNFSLACSHSYILLFFSLHT